MSLVRSVVANVATEHMLSTAGSSQAPWHQASGANASFGRRATCTIRYTPSRTFHPCCLLLRCASRANGEPVGQAETVLFGALRFCGRVRMAFVAQDRGGVARWVVSENRTMRERLPDLPTRSRGSKTETTFFVV